MDDLEVLGRAVHAVDWTHATILFSEDAGRNDISILSFSRILVLFFFKVLTYTVTRYITDRAVTMCQTAGFSSSRIAVGWYST